MKVDVECIDCNGEGEVGLFKEVCRSCKGAGVVIATRRFARPQIKRQGFVASSIYQKPIDNDVDKIVIVAYDDGRDVAHWFCGTEDHANEVKIEKEANGQVVEQYTPTEYYKEFGSQFKYRNNI